MVESGNLPGPPGFTTSARPNTPWPDPHWGTYRPSCGIRDRRPLCDSLAHLLPGTFGWGAIATLATWLMTLFITRTEHRDTQAIHAKIDELLRAHGEARTELAHLDEKDVEEIEAHRSETRQAARDRFRG
jgi:Low affinity iron permease